MYILTLLVSCDDKRNYLTVNIIVDISNLKNDDYKIIFFPLLHYLWELMGSSVQCLMLGLSFLLCCQITLLAEKINNTPSHHCRPNLQVAHRAILY